MRRTELFTVRPAAAAVATLKPAASAVARLRRAAAALAISAGRVRRSGGAAALAISFGAALLVSFPLPAAATDWGFPPAALGCDAPTDAAVAACVGAAYAAADAELNAVWGKVIAGITPAASGLDAAQVRTWTDDLIAAQRAWIVFRDKDCLGARSFEMGGGSATGIAVTSCLYEYTANRAADLKARYLDR